jgi:hypothetical protein
MKTQTLSLQIVNWEGVILFTFILYIHSEKTDSYSHKLGVPKTSNQINP